MGVGMRIKSILRDRKQTIKQLAEQANVPVNTLYSITKRDSERVDDIILNRIADALDVPVPVLMGLDQIDKYFWGKEAAPEIYKKMEENYQRHHGGQARANAAMEQMTEEGRNKVADYAEDILARYQVPSVSPDISSDTDASEMQENADDTDP